MSPPFDEGALHVSATCALPATPETDCAAEGAVRGTTELVDVEGSPAPATFFALTLKT